MVVTWCSDPTWKRAHAVRLKDHKVSRLSLCRIRPYGGWRLDPVKSKCKNCLREMEKGDG